MPNIRPSSDLRNKYNEISEFCHKYNEPVFITKNGTGDLVLMSNASGTVSGSTVTFTVNLNANETNGMVNNTITFTDTNNESPRTTTIVLTQYGS